MLLGVITVFLCAFFRLKKRGESVYDLFIVSACTLLAALMGASLLFAIVTYPISFILESLFSGNFEVFGGLVYYGGLIGGIVGAMIGIKIAKGKLQPFENAIVPFMPIGHAIGRIGCVMAGCCKGFEYDGPFALYYPGFEHGHFPVQIVEAFFNVIIAIILIVYSKKERKTYGILLLYLLLYSVSRFLLELMRGDAVRGIFFGLSTSQWIAIALFAVSLLFIFIRKIRKA